jgi:hypothetical protein
MFDDRSSPRGVNYVTDPVFSRGIVPGALVRVTPSASGQMTIDLGRRRFIFVFSGAAATWPLAARAAA